MLRSNHTFLTAAAGILLDATSAYAAVDLDTSPCRVPGSLAAILAVNGSGDHYPTDTTRNLVPKPVHGYDDYWRGVYLPYFYPLLPETAAAIIP